MQSKQPYKINPFYSIDICLRTSTSPPRPAHPRLKNNAKYTLPQPEMDKAELTGWLLKRLQADPLRK